MKSFFIFVQTQKKIKLKSCASYIAKQNKKSILSELPYAPLTLVIPCYNEPNILATLESIWKNEEYDKRLHIIVVVNQNEDTSEECITQNKKTLQELKSVKENYANSLHSLSILYITFPSGEDGVGAARKVGMDEAVRQYVQHGKDGIIISLDADTIVSTNYLAEIYNAFTRNPKTNTLIINYEHPLHGLTQTQKRAIIQYELYLRYMTLAYRYVEHPNAFHTIGSAFAVRTSAYCKQGGMNKRQAGEDFYFLQKLMAFGGCSELNTTCIFPSSRTSDRVPFGTGKAIKELIDSNNELQTYSFKAFEELKIFFDMHESLYKITKLDFETIVYNELGGLIKSWLIEDNFFSQLQKINGNCASLEIFSKKFFESFSILQIIKYLNFSHTHFVQKSGIYHAISCLPQSEIFDFQNPKSLLLSVRRYLQKDTFVKL
ncbi:MAG: family 2 glycosyl transferase [Bacteroidia bacterium]|nr:MAG: family 2 glycosyl transferase [Bacteroidia bacterium]